MRPTRRRKLEQPEALGPPTASVGGPLAAGVSRAAAPRDGIGSGWGTNAAGHRGRNVRRHGMTQCAALKRGLSRGVILATVTLDAAAWPTTQTAPGTPPIVSRRSLQILRLRGPPPVDGQPRGIAQEQFCGLLVPLE